MADARARKFNCLLVWKLDRFGRSLVDCLNNIQELERHRIRFIATTQNLDTDEKNPASRFLLHVLGAAAEFERSLIRERTLAGQIRYRSDYASGKVGKTVSSRSGKNLPPHRPLGRFSIVNRSSNYAARGSLFAKLPIGSAWESGRSPGRCKLVPKVRSGYAWTRTP